ncbi:hypothetical protein [Nocardia sp. NBC_00403]|uniref:hypothetical protein n=1 Tax=Nocardia sp. NBC_00403 TaxID=2975990 RepID=UPI002E1A417B
MASLAAAIAITTIDATGVRRSELATRVIDTVAAGVPAPVVDVDHAGTQSAATVLPDQIGPRRVLEGAELLCALGQPGNSVSL